MLADKESALDKERERC